MVWRNAEVFPQTKSYVCGHCDITVGAHQGYWPSSHNPPKPGGVAICICPNCTKPTFFDGETQMPGVAFGGEVKNLPESVHGLYNEARNCMKVSAYTACILAARKLLMNVAVSQGAAPGDSFVSYVSFLATNGYVPPNARGWVDHIRKKGNEATHEIPSLGRGDAEDLLTFMEMILKLVFDYPSRVPASGS